MEYQEALNLFNYDKQYGKIYWKPKNVYNCKSEKECARWNSRFSNKEVGCLNSHGYRKTKFLNKLVSVHRLIWLMEYGEYPNDQLDHINGNRDDNRIENLRISNPLINMQNRKQNENCKSGCSGVYFNKRENKWRAHIKSNKKNIHLGYYIDLNDAVNARKQAEIKYGFHENHGRLVQN